MSMGRAPIWSLCSPQSSSIRDGEAPEVRISIIRDTLITSTFRSSVLDSRPALSPRFVPTSLERTTMSYFPFLSLKFFNQLPLMFSTSSPITFEAAGLLVLADLPAVALRTALTGGASFLDACPGHA
ncbi:uncharacterized protein ARMOST_20820 [Armillaria ostoyae]|uniref:Uncharacterized protein n=1 Tax=Armillaria ostoyae TaxID=47428 RepID=A0A284S8E6_ARMOS|nr:uncharacterized protein ARMOST_20820 [Armillaria ostoyae]